MRIGVVGRNGRVLLNDASLPKLAESRGYIKLPAKLWRRRTKQERGMSSTSTNQSSCKPKPPTRDPLLYLVNKATARDSTAARLRCMYDLFLESLPALPVDIPIP